MTRWHNFMRLQRFNQLTVCWKYFNLKFSLVVDTFKKYILPTFYLNRYSIIKVILNYLIKVHTRFLFFF